MVSMLPAGGAVLDIGALDVVMWQVFHPRHLVWRNLNLPPGHVTAGGQVAAVFLLCLLSAHWGFSPRADGSGGRRGSAYVDWATPGRLDRQLPW